MLNGIRIPIPVALTDTSLPRLPLAWVPSNSHVFMQSGFVGTSTSPPGVTTPDGLQVHRVIAAAGTTPTWWYGYTDPRPSSAFTIPLNQDYTVSGYARSSVVGQLEMGLKYPYNGQSPLSYDQKVVLPTANTWVKFALAFNATLGALGSDQVLRWTVKPLSGVVASNDIPLVGTHDVAFVITTAPPA